MQRSRSNVRDRGANPHPYVQKCSKQNGCETNQVGSLSVKISLKEAQFERKGTVTLEDTHLIGPTQTTEASYWLWLYIFVQHQGLTLIRDLLMASVDRRNDYID